MASFQESVRILRSVIGLLEEREDGKLSSLERDVLRQRLITVYEMLWDREQPDTLNTPLVQETEAESPVVQDVKDPEPEVLPVSDAEPENEVPEKSAEMPPLQEEKPPVADEKRTSLNERFAGDKTTLADKILKPQGQLKNLIDVNEKFFFTKELFGGDRKAFEQAIDKLDACAGLEEALGLIDGEYSRRYNWESGSRAVDKFMKEILLRFSR